MFFADPTAAFFNIRRSLRPSGRLAFVCWQALEENPLDILPLSAASAHLPPPPASDPDAPGPFAFAAPTVCLVFWHFPSTPNNGHRRSSGPCRSRANKRNSRRPTKRSEQFQETRSGKRDMPHRARLRCTISATDRFMRLGHSHEEPFSPAGSAALRGRLRRRTFSPDVLVVGLGFDWPPGVRAHRRRRCSISVRRALHVVRLGGS